MPRRVLYKETFRRKRRDPLMDWTWTVTARNILQTTRGEVRIVRLSAYGHSVTLHVTEDYLSRHFRPTSKTPER